MNLDDRQTWALLRQLDDPDHMEFPRDYDHVATRAKFEWLVSLLDERFRCACDVDRHIQDASHHGTIVIPQSVTDSAEHISVTVSNFGDLATVALGVPGSHDADEERELFRATDRERVEEALETLGYVTVPQHLLWTRYDGVSELASYYPPEYPPTWRTRFFQHL
ncbi:hypothetical protein AB0D34_14885 [Streptomyces sp. NPDC048420]|uniref:hypothetical protein n=1 Tax=Streptomyces sp. NPDC048420 TaxID=3155755 RepID=UPI003443F02B